MKITKIKAENFKSYKKISVDLNNLNFIIGGNASGKSNLVNILKFFNDIVEYGIDDAILLQGGIKYLFNSNSSRDARVLLNFVISLEEEQEIISNLYSIEKSIHLPQTLNYTLEIKPHERGSGYKISYENLEIFFNEIKKIEDKLEKINTVSLTVTRNSSNKITDNLNSQKFDHDDELLSINNIVKFITKREELFLNNFFYIYSIFYKYNSKVKIYNFDVNLLKSSSSIVARSELEENGSNLVNIIQQLLKSKAKKDKLNKIIKMILPFVDDIKVESSVNKSLFFKVKESYNKNEFPSYMLSDGTVNILAVIVALYFQDDNEILILEEPERNIHPKLLSAIVSILKDVSSKKQIFVTTHNPYVIKEADLNDVILVSRNEEGISNISRPVNNKKVEIFLKNDLGIADLFVDGILK